MSSVKVLTEACFLIQRNGGKPAEVLKKVQAGVIAVALELQTGAAALETLRRRYEDTPMSLADARLVRPSELHSDRQVFTLDADVRCYPTGAGSRPPNHTRNRLAPPPPRGAP